MDINSYLPPAYFAAERQTDRLLFGDGANSGVQGGYSYEQKLAALEEQGTGVSEAREAPVSQKTYDGLSISRMMHIENGVQPSINAMSDAYEGLMAEMSLEAPELTEKDWDFSNDEAGEFVIIEGDQKLSDEEISYIEKKFKDAGVADAYTDFADTAVNAINDSYTGRQYGLSKENFSERISGREFLNTEKLKHQDDPISLKTGEKISKANWSGGLVAQLQSAQSQKAEFSTQHINVKA